MTSPAQPAGWYADPSGLPATRWWDGQRWTEHLQPGPAVLPPTAGLGGYYPTVAPSGPLVPGPHTVSPADPDDAEIFAAQASGAVGAAFPAPLAAGGLVGGALAAPAAEQIAYPMPPVDGPASLFTDAGRSPAFPGDPAGAFAASGTPAPPDVDRRPSARHATGLLTHPLLLASLAAVVLAALVAFTLLR